MTDKIYAELGTDNQNTCGRSPGENWRIMPEDRPEGFFICKAINKTTGKWVEGMTPSQAKLYGTDIDGVMCSATGDDQNGVTAMYLKVKINGSSENLVFSNDSVYPLTPENFDAFYLAWTTFRQSFFA